MAYPAAAGTGILGSTKAMGAGDDRMLAVHDKGSVNPLLAGITNLDRER
ncbi:MAG: hypothetical protein IPJ97_17040 [Proteobacteria bacterium]|nr:hypothetical protein [Pseudomonadota bacterium]